MPNMWFLYRKMILFVFLKKKNELKVDKNV